MSEAREEKKTRLRQKILESARDVFFRDGFMNANLDEVARGADVAKGTLYRYFANKGELYVGVLARNGDIFLERLREAAARKKTSADRIRDVSRFYFNHWARNHEYFEIFWALENQRVIGELPAGVVGEVTQLWERSLRVLTEVIEEGSKSGEFVPCDAWEVANILWSVANGLIQTEHATPRRELRGRGLEKVFHDMTELFLRGLASSPGPFPT